MRLFAIGSALLALLVAPTRADASTTSATPPVQRPRMMAPPALPPLPSERGMPPDTATSAPQATPTPAPQATPTPAPAATPTLAPATEPVRAAATSLPTIAPPPARPAPASPAHASAPLELTRSPAPPSRPLPPSPDPVADPSADHGTGEVATLTRSAAKKKPKIRHDGFTVDFRVGMLGCMRQVCSDRHRAETPGVRLDGFLGGNIRGFVDVGIAGGWGRLKPEVEPGTNVLSLYGVDPVALTAQLPPAMAAMVPLAAFAAQDAKLQAAQGGPSVRVHFVPRGRVLAYVGSGAQYNLFRADYHTAMGAVRVDLHGIAVPVEVGLGVHVQKNLALVAHFDWRWTWYGLAVLDNPMQQLTVPMSYLADTAREQGFEIRKELPQFWTMGFALRARV